jgi:acyl-CoA reductase-like NAD-dependent aldehyde dehydrogenase
VSDSAADSRSDDRGVTPLAQLAAAVNRLADAIAEQKEELGRLESHDTGACIDPMTNDIGTAIT